MAFPNSGMNPSMKMLAYKADNQILFQSKVHLSTL